MSATWSDRRFGADFATAVDEDRVYVADGLELRSLAREDGTEVWQVDGDYQQVYLGPDLVIANHSGGHRTTAFDPVDGSVVWQASHDFIEQLTPRLGVTHADGLSGVDLETGKCTWHLAIGDEQHPLGALDGSVFVGIERRESPGSLLAVDAATGRERWRTSLPVGSLAGGVVDGSLYASVTPEAESRSRIVSVAPVDGTVEWRRDVGRRCPDAVPRGTLDGTVVFGQWVSDGSLPDTAALAVDDGAVRWARRDHRFAGAAGGVAALTGKNGSVVGVSADGTTRYEENFRFVPMRGGHYSPPVLSTDGDAFVGGFAGTNALVEWHIPTGQRTWRHHFEDAAIRRFDHADGDLLVVTEHEIWYLRVSDSV